MTRRDIIKATAVLGMGTLAVTEAYAETFPVAKEWYPVETSTGKAIRFRDLAEQLAKANAIFVGEFHDDPQTHRAEAALLEAVYAKVGDKLTLAMEMLERDAQTVLNDYLAGKIDEEQFSKSANLWKNYKTDYRPMVQYARTKSIPVLASNAPQVLVRRVSREGLSVMLPTLDPAARAQLAEFFNTPEDAYYRNFAEVMSGGGMAHGEGGMKPDALHRIYEAQCVRDDTMAETVARELAKNRTVFHVNGAFHSDGALGTAARTLWRRPLGTRLAIVKIVPVRNLEPAKVDIAPYKTAADFVIFVPDERPHEKDSA